MGVGMETRGAGRAVVALRVLVIDGTQGRGELMAQHLRAEGMEPTVVGSTQDAWHLLEWAPADVVLLRADGELAEACEMAPALARRGVVLVTASAEPVRPDVRRRALAAGVQDMLVAPFDAREMAARLDAATFDARAAEAAPVVGRPRVPMATAVDDDAKTRAEAGLPAALRAEVAGRVPMAAAMEDDAKTRAEARPAALVAEEAGAEGGGGAEVRGEAERPASTGEAAAAPPDRESLAEMSVLEGLEGGGLDRGPARGGSQADAADAMGGAVGGAVGFSGAEAPALAVLVGLSSEFEVAAAGVGRGAEPFDAIGALSENGLLNWLGDEDDMPGAIPAEGWQSGQDLAASADFERLMTGVYPDPMLDDLEAEVDAQIEAEAARLGGARGPARAGAEGGPESGMDALKMHGADAATDDAFGCGGGGTRGAVAAATEASGADGTKAEGDAAPRMDVEAADLEVGPGTRDVLAAGLGRARSRRLMWRTATAMMGTVLLGLVGIVGWRLVAAPPGTPPGAGLVAGEALRGDAAGGEAAGGGPESGQGVVVAAGAREPEAPEPSSHEESNALLFGEAVEALNSGWPDDADDRLRLLLRSDPSDRRGMAGLASALGQQGEFEAARAMLDTLAEQAQSEPGALLTLGLVAHRLGDTEGARRGLERFVEAAPEDPRAEQVRRLLASLGAG